MLNSELGERKGFDHRFSEDFELPAGSMLWWWQKDNTASVREPRSFA
jgi:hypothetical protein